MNAAPDIVELGDRALQLRYGDTVDARVNARVVHDWRRLRQAALPGVVDLVPAYTTLTAIYDWQQLPEAGQERPWSWLRDAVAAALRQRADLADTRPREIELPVCYEHAHAPDLDAIALRLGLSTSEVVDRHCRARYTVAFLGFRPGFPYLLGLDPTLAVPRRETPRLRIEAGSVGIGGDQTGIYPEAGPGGWQLIGRCPVPLFDPEREPPALLAPGDCLQLRPIDGDAFQRLLPTTIPRVHPAEDGNAVFEVVRPGLSGVLRGSARTGCRHLGVSPGGPADAAAALLANALVGNADDAVVLESTLSGPQLRARAPATIALVGSGMTATLDARPMPLARPVSVEAGQLLQFRASGDGARSWLAVAGGFTPTTGENGAALRAGDILQRRPVADTAQRGTASWWIDADIERDRPLLLRFVIDADADPDAVRRFVQTSWRIGAEADRSGLRLDGPVISWPGSPRVSAAVMPGSIQLPSDGRPIALGIDAPTTGGYPLLGHIIEADLRRLAQLKPGDDVALQPVELDEAQAARVAQAQLVSRLKIAIAGRRGR